MPGSHTPTYSAFWPGCYSWPLKQKWSPGIRAPWDPFLFLAGEGRGGFSPREMGKTRMPGLYCICQVSLYNHVASTCCASVSPLMVPGYPLGSWGFPQYQWL